MIWIKLFNQKRWRSENCPVVGSNPLRVNSFCLPDPIKRNLNIGFSREEENLVKLFEKMDTEISFDLPMEDKMLYHKCYLSGGRPPDELLCRSFSLGISRILALTDNIHQFQA